ncbi:MAG: hypothetical protein RL065_105 [Bacteroidota bacterium]
MNPTRYIIIATLCFISFFAFAQKKEIKEKRIIQFSGMVLSSDSLEVLPFALIYDKTINKGSYSTINGFFSFAASEGDSIYFSYIGYKKKLVVIPYYLPDARYSMMQLMSADTINLAVTIIRPYPKPEEFKKAFLEAKVPDDDMDRALKNLKRMSSDDLTISVPIDGREASNTFLRNYASTYYYKGQVPPQNIFNPLAWAEFFKAWKRGDFKKKSYY